jgi:alginate production protein
VRAFAVTLLVGASARSVCGAELDEAEALREKLTEREDKRRPEQPYSVPVAGRPLTLDGEFELEFLELRRWIVGEQIDEPDRRLLALGLDLEAFYSFGPQLSLFAQIRLVLEEDLLPDTPDELSSQSIQRQEMWAASEGIGGTGFSVEAGRLSFQDERRWWWDDELDALRVRYETEAAEVSLAFARELAPRRSDTSYVEPENDRVYRVIGELGLDFQPEHALELFALHQDDRSRTRRVGSVIDTEREDQPDSSLTWVGARLQGTFDIGPPGALGYWLDAASLRGREHWTEYAEFSDDQSVVESVTRRDVDGWGFDVGASWLPELAWEPRVFAGYALASKWFRQTGIQANEAGFGGVEGFGRYGFLLDPELSNLQVWTGGIGCSLLRSSSLDLVYHEYRLHQRADSLWGSGLELSLDGESRKVGRELDLVLALEEWEHLELEFAAAAFQPGASLGSQQGRWSYGSFVAIRYAF